MGQATQPSVRVQQQHPRPEKQVEQHTLGCAVGTWWEQLRIHVETWRTSSTPPVSLTEEATRTTRGCRERRGGRMGRWSLSRRWQT
jgi:hypothetical protein